MNFDRTLVLLGCLAGLEVLSAQTAPAPQTAQPAFAGMSSTTQVKDSTLLDNLHPMPQGKLTLLGGTIDSIDGVRDELVLQTFGGGRMKVLFDERTHVYLDRLTVGKQRDLRRGQRIHLDVALNGSKVFAQSIYVLSQLPTLESSGQVVSYQASSRELVMRESSLETTVRMHVLPSTVVFHQDRPVSPLEIEPGSLISVAFQPEGDGRVVASRISVVAKAGDMFTFAGRVVHLDLRSQLVVLETLPDRKTYEIYFDASRAQGIERLREGVDATISAKFDGTRYVAGALVINP